MLFKQELFTEEEKKSIVQAIGEAEAMTSGEIRLHIEAKCSGDPVARAVEMFYKLGMDKTAQQNGVLIYLAHSDHKFAIVGDKGINEVVPSNFWDGIKEAMKEHFKQKEFFQGVVFAVKETGFHLKSYFPLQHNDKNELPNEISEG